MRIRPMGRVALLAIVTAAMFGTTACGPKKPPVARPMPAPEPPVVAAPLPPMPPPPAAPAATPPAPVPEPSVPEDTVGSKSLDDLNRDSPLKPVFFGLDSAEIDETAQQALKANAEVLRRYRTWALTVEGHCDERGTAEYNLGLGERRATAARDYLVTLGIEAGRLKVVSYGKEFPFDPGHDDAAWAKNRRAHFVVTAK